MAGRQTLEVSTDTQFGDFLEVINGLPDEELASTDILIAESREVMSLLDFAANFGRENARELIARMQLTKPQPKPGPEFECESTESTETTEPFQDEMATSDDFMDEVIGAIMSPSRGPRN